MHTYLMGLARGFTSFLTKPSTNSIICMCKESGYWTGESLQNVKANFSILCLPLIIKIKYQNLKGLFKIFIPHHVNVFSLSYTVKPV